MWPLSTVTEPNRFMSSIARAPSSVPQPHFSYTVHSGMWANTTIGISADFPLRSSAIHLSYSSPRFPSPPAWGVYRLLIGHQLDTERESIEIIEELAALCALGKRVARVGG